MFDIELLTQNCFWNHDTRTDWQVVGISEAGLAMSGPSSKVIVLLWELCPIMTIAKHHGWYVLSGRARLSQDKTCKLYYAHIHVHSLSTSFFILRICITRVSSMPISVFKIR